MNVLGVKKENWVQNMTRRWDSILQALCQWWWSLCLPARASEMRHMPVWAKAFSGLHISEDQHRGKTPFPTSGVSGGLVSCQWGLAWSASGFLGSLTHLIYIELALRHSKPHAESTVSGEPNLACSVHDIVRPDEIWRKRSWKADQWKELSKTSRTLDVHG